MEDLGRDKLIVCREWARQRRIYGGSVERGKEKKTGGERDGGVARGEKRRCSLRSGDTLMISEVSIMKFQKLSWGAPHASNSYLFRRRFHD